MTHDPVAVAIVTSDRGVLAGRRRDGVPPWTFPGGKVEPGESPAEAAVREVREETGLEVLAGGGEIGWRVHPTTGRHLLYMACTPAVDDEPVVAAPGELVEVRWLSLAEVDTLIPGVFEPVREHLGRLIS